MQMENSSLFYFDWDEILKGSSCDKVNLNFYPIYQPLRSGRIWHKVNFLSGV